MQGVRTRYETELANEYGNLASRTLAMVQRYRSGVVPAATRDPALDADLEGLPAEVAALMDRAQPTQALEHIWQRVRRLNRYVEERAPWQLAKEPAQTDQLEETLASLHEGVRALSVLLHPFMPVATQTLLDACGAPDTAYAAAEFAPNGSGARVQTIAPLFPKRDR
jgi:methionyl-tRNA synthetase